MFVACFLYDVESRVVAESVPLAEWVKDYPPLVWRKGKLYGCQSLPNHGVRLGSADYRLKPDIDNLRL